MRPTGISIGEHMRQLIIGETSPLPDPLYALGKMNSNSLKAQYCLAMAGYYRTMWDKGKQELIKVMSNPWGSDSMAARYGHLSRAMREDYAVIMWYKSQRARDLLDAEEQWQRRAAAFGVVPEGGDGNGHNVRPATVPNAPQYMHPMPA